jgi:hypothetical protein
MEIKWCWVNIFMSPAAVLLSSSIASHTSGFCLLFSNTSWSQIVFINNQLFQSLKNNNDIYTAHKGINNRCRRYRI